MNLGFLLLTDHSESINGKLYAMGAGWNMLRFPGLPAEYGFGIALGIDVAWEETNAPHSMELHVEGPDGERLGGTFNLGFEAGRPAGVVAGQDQRIVLSLGTRTTFEATGPHAVVVDVDGRELGRSRFYVVRAAPEMARPSG